VTSPRLSVVLPAYNAAATIDVQLAALARQRVAGAWEVIVADNGSADDTVARACRWADRIPAIRVVDASHRRGPGAARNIGAAAAHGEVLLFCDADDAAEPGWASGLADALEDAEAAAGGRRYSELNAVAHGPMDWSEPLYTKAPLTHLGAASSHNLGVRAAVFAAVGGFDESLPAGEDVDFCWRLQLAGFRLVAVPGALMQIRRRHGLLPTYRQARAYGRADALLARKYAAVPVPATAYSADARTDETTPATRGLIARLRDRGLRPPDPVYLLDRLGRRRGESLGRRDPHPGRYRAGGAS
jgi:glycosyltransferase involved in cell wall biosynthesis